MQLPDGGTHDVTLACDVTATVADLARTLIRAGLAADPLLGRIAAERLRPVTIRGSSTATAPPVLLDPGSPVAGSGLQSGWTIEPVAEFGGAPAERLVTPAGYLEVLTGSQAGALFSLVPGMNLVGRDPGSRAHLKDPSVSRRHAAIECGTDGETRLHDLGSANGTRVALPENAGAGAGAGGGVGDHGADEKNREGGHARNSDNSAGVRLRGPTELQVGDVVLKFTPGPPPQILPTHTMSARVLPHRALHTRSPRIDPVFPQTNRQLPAPPPATQTTRIPTLALIAPVIMGGVLFLVTGQALMLMMMAFTPVMMLGSWVDGAVTKRRKQRRAGQRFRAALAAERTELEALLEQEIAVRGTETPTVPEIADAMSARSGLLWARRPEHGAFLEARLGEGELPSRTTLTAPARGDGPHEDWAEVRALETEFATAHPVPVLERFDRCGSIGVAGDPVYASGLARSLVLQLAGLHSPEELVLACFAGGGRAGGGTITGAPWEWLKWLPHSSPVTSPIGAWQLADDEASTTRLLIAIEALIEGRSGAVPGSGVRSHLAADTRNDEGRGEAVKSLRPLPAVVALVLADGAAPDAATLSRLIGVAEAGPDVGVHLIWVARSRAELPAACRTFVDLDRAGSTVGFVRTGTRVALSRAEFVDLPVAVQLARTLAPVEDAAARALDESDLPKQVALRELHPIDLATGPAPILRAWQGTLASNWVRGSERDEVSLAAPVGQGPAGPAMIDLRRHGPHALVGGTTGSGKSEFLQTWIMSLAALISPDRLTYLLVDYKGGAAFAECVDLPHTVGLVTDLSPHLVRRALTSLRAELRYREELLAEHGAKDLATMERRSDPAAPPALVIVIDEFAALASDVPEFVEGVVDVAQRGRSLGLHLILATQRPAGVIKDNLRANTNLRVALRMADEADSSDVIGVKDAAFFAAETPGRGAIKVGPGRIAHFQTGYLGGRATERAPVPTLEIRSLGFAEGEPWAVPPEPGGRRLAEALNAAPDHAVRAKPPRDIERLRDNLVAAAHEAGVAAPRKPWLDELPRVLGLAGLAELRPAGTADAAGSAGSLSSAERSDAVAIGLSDLPELQAQQPVMIDLEHTGNVAIIGASGTGKTSALITLAQALSAQAMDHPVELYGIDAGGGALDAIRSLPTVGAVVPLADTELTGRVLRRVLDALTERASRFAAARCNGLAAYRRTATASRIVLLIDGFAALRQAAEAPAGPHTQLQQLTDIMATGRAAGVHVIMTCDRPGAIPTALAASVQEQYVLRLANPADYGYFAGAAEMLDGAGPGRAVLVGGAQHTAGAAGSSGAPGVPGTSGRRRGPQLTELQFALAGGEPELRAQTRAVETLAEQLRHAQLPPVAEVRKAPTFIALNDLAASIGDRPTYGIDTSDLAPITLPTRGLGVIAGPSGAGLSTAAATCAIAAARGARARGETTELILLTLTDDGLRRRGIWDRIAHEEDAVRDLARELTIRLGGKPPRGPQLLPGLIGGPVDAVHGAEAPGAVPDLVPDPASPTPAPVSRPVIVIERASTAEGTEALAELVALVKTARRADALVLVEFEQGTGGAIWDLFAALKQPTWGLALQPDEGESQSPFREHLGRVKRADFPPGRGFAIEGGRATPVHVAICAGATEENLIEL
nr:FtsK/SpoIIIE domain-containing protein [Leucobacter exalbidus]